MSNAVSNQAIIEIGTNDAERLRNRAMGAGVIYDPHPIFDRLRETGPVHAGSVGEHFGLDVTTSAMGWSGRPHFSAYSWASVDQILRDRDTFSSGWYQAALRPVVGYAVIEMDLPDHRRHRALVQPSFMRREMGRWRERWVEPIVTRLVDQLAAGPDRTDLYTELCANLPVHTIAATFGIARENVEHFHELVVRMVGGSETPEQAFAAVQEISATLSKIIEDRRAAPREDLISVLTQAEMAGDDGVPHRLNDEEVLTFSRLLLPAGAGTTYRALGCLLLQLLKRPEVFAAVKADRSLLESAMEESLRLEQPLAVLGRIATRDTELFGVKIPQGAIVQISTSAANHDPARWKNPHEYNIYRESQPHISFGMAAHTCLGVHLARTEMLTAMEALFERFPNMRLDESAPEPFVTGLAFRLPTAVPVVLG